MKLEVRRLLKPSQMPIQFFPESQISLGRSCFHLKNKDNNNMSSHFLSVLITKNEWA